MLRWAEKEHSWPAPLELGNLFGPSGKLGQVRDALRLLACALIENGFPPIGAGLIVEGDLTHGAHEILFAKILAHFERVEAGARHESQLIVQKMPDGSDLALETQPGAQHPGPGEAAPVPKSRKFDRHEGNFLKIGPND